ncbi:MAG: hypothetical protein HFG26_04350 [Provencibacterium sp.]|jgi:hypothetical protein|nr:hypothetical protein [Provencibacterium sp.]
MVAEGKKMGYNGAGTIKGGNAMDLFHKPGEPIFLKESRAAQEKLRQLEALLPSAGEACREAVEQDIRLTKAGIAGEEQILFELRNSHLPLYVLHDLFIRDGDLTAQIDFVVITPKLNFFLECKNLFGNIQIGADGSFVRSLRTEGKTVREGIYSPVTQNERHMELVKTLRSKSMGPLRRSIFLSSFYDFNRPFVVLANPKTVLDAQQAPEDIRSQVIRADQLVRSIKESCQQSKEFSLSPQGTEKMARKLLSLHVEEPKDYTAKYREAAVRKEEGPSRRFGTQETAETLRCPWCGSALIQRNGKFGAFWGCSQFPNCRYARKL